MVRKIILGVVGVLVLLIGGILIYASTRPDTFRVERSLSMKAPADKIHPLINDFHQWTKWSPWEKLDPNLKRTYSGAEEGVGAIYNWSGNDKVGEGRMEIIQSEAPTHVQIKLDFMRPWEGHMTTDFKLMTSGDTTTVNWTSSGPASLMSRVMCLFIDMDKMIGNDFESGLANMKAIAEKATAEEASVDKPAEAKAEEKNKGN